MNGHSEIAIQETNGDEYEYERVMRQSLEESIEFNEELESCQQQD